MESIRPILETVREKGGEMMAAEHGQWYYCSNCTGEWYSPSYVVKQPQLCPFCCTGTGSIRELPQYIPAPKPQPDIEKLKEQVKEKIKKKWDAQHQKIFNKWCFGEGWQLVEIGSQLYRLNTDTGATWEYVGGKWLKIKEPSEQ